MPLRRSQSLPRRAKTTPRRTQDGLKTFQVAPRRAKAPQGAPRYPQDAPTTAPRRPKTLQEAAKMIKIPVLIGKSSFGAPNIIQLFRFQSISRFSKISQDVPKTPKTAPDPSKKLEDLPKTSQDVSRRSQDGSGFTPGRDERSERASAASDASEAIRLFHVCLKLSESLPKRFLAFQIQYLFNALGVEIC